MKNKKIILIICIISICISIAFIMQTYAKYLTSATGNSSINIANWNIKVNNQSILTNADISAIITPVFPGNDYMAPNVIAPTAEGYFDLNFDFTNVDVSFQYTISTSVNEKSDVPDLIVTGYSIDDGNVINSNTDITENILYSDNVDNKKIRIYIKWDDSATSTMDNAQDTGVANTGKALLDVTVHFVQIPNAPTPTT